MRVAVACGPFAGLTSAQTGAAVARAWAELGCQLAVLPVAECGHGFTEAWTDLAGATPTVEVVPGAELGPAGLLVRPTPAAHGGSETVGELLRQALEGARAGGEHPQEVWLEVESHHWADGGEGFWHACSDAHDLLRESRLHLVTSQAQATMHLTGLRGITAATAASGAAHPGELIAADQRLVDWCRSIGAPQLGTTPGAGAVGGLGAAVMALGGDVVTGPAECARLAGMERTVARADLVVTGVDELEFGTKGGDLLPLVTGLAEAATRPVVAVARRNWISARELRTMGVEEGYSLVRVEPGLAPLDVEQLDEEAITRLCRPVARTWSW